MPQYADDPEYDLKEWGEDRLVVSKSEGDTGEWIMFDPEEDTVKVEDWR